MYSKSVFFFSLIFARSQCVCVCARCAVTFCPSLSRPPFLVQLNRSLASSFHISLILVEAEFDLHTQYIHYCEIVGWSVFHSMPFDFRASLSLSLCFATDAYVCQIRFLLLLISPGFVFLFLSLSFAYLYRTVCIHFICAFCNKRFVCSVCACTPPPPPPPPLVFVVNGYSPILFWIPLSPSCSLWSCCTKETETHGAESTHILSSDWPIDFNWYNNVMSYVMTSIWEIN